jgi:hypothetical protein
MKPALAGTVFLDVNGTLLPATGPRIGEASVWARFRVLVGLLRDAGMVTGLCSDSPLESLRAFGQAVGLGEPGGFPVVAENGNVVESGGTVRILTPFPARTRVRTFLVRLARSHGLTQRPDLLAPEFSGAAMDGGSWALGLHRRASVSIFAPPPYITAAAGSLLDWAAKERIELSVDSSPQHSFLGVHPYAERWSGKSRALAGLAGRGHQLFMIGDSVADWVPPGLGVRCGFVGGAEIPYAIRSAAWARSAKPDLEGVLELLERLLALESFCMEGMMDGSYPCRRAWLRHDRPTDAPALSRRAGGDVRDRGAG